MNVSGPQSRVTEIESERWVENNIIDMPRNATVLVRFYQKCHFRINIAHNNGARHCAFSHQQLRTELYFMTLVIKKKLKWSLIGLFKSPYVEFMAKLILHIVPQCFARWSLSLIIISFRCKQAHRTYDWFIWFMLIFLKIFFPVLFCEKQYAREFVVCPY